MPKIEKRCQHNKRARCYWIEPHCVECYHYLHKMGKE